MRELPHILADSIDGQVRVLFWLLVVVIWAISAIAGKVKKAAQKDRERLRAVRQSIEQSRGIAQPQAGRVRPPVQLAPEIARRVPPLRVTRAPEAPPGTAPVVLRAAANYNVVAKALTRATAAPPPLPVKRKKATPEVQLEEVSPSQGGVASPAPATVGAAAIRRWLRPTTLRQQFILTELFQTPLSLREPRHW